jgi:hypothetical protein
MKNNEINNKKNNLKINLVNFIDLILYLIL